MAETPAPPAMLDLLLASHSRWSTVVAADELPETWQALHLASVTDVVTAGDALLDEGAYGWSLDDDGPDGLDESWGPDAGSEAAAMLDGALERHALAGLFEHDSAAFETVASEATGRLADPFDAALADDDLGDDDLADDDLGDDDLGDDDLADVITRYVGARETLVATNVDIGPVEGGPEAPAPSEVDDPTFPLDDMHVDEPFDVAPLRYLDDDAFGGDDGNPGDDADRDDDVDEDDV